MLECTVQLAPLVGNIFPSIAGAYPANQHTGPNMHTLNSVCVCGCELCKSATCINQAQLDAKCELAWVLSYSTKVMCPLQFKKLRAIPWSGQSTLLPQPCHNLNRNSKFHFGGTGGAFEVKAAATSMGYAWKQTRGRF